MALAPLADRVLAKRIDEEEQQTSGGIIIPDTAKEKPPEAAPPGARKRKQNQTVLSKIAERGRPIKGAPAGNRGTLSLGLIPLMVPSF